mmetsp:Transcript_51688/g.117721  ORF Transcript_51688/g.117721 Transcript_51688/m.117721 type:complete len:204 (+) Transcript_51688:650-1261(+)
MRPRRGRARARVCSGVARVDRSRRSAVARPMRGAQARGQRGGAKGESRPQPGDRLRGWRGRRGRRGKRRRPPLCRWTPRTRAGGPGMRWRAATRPCGSAAATSGRRGRCSAGPRAGWSTSTTPSGSSRPPTSAGRPSGSSLPHPEERPPTPPTKPPTGTLAGSRAEWTRQVDSRRCAQASSRPAGAARGRRVAGAATKPPWCA